MDHDKAVTRARSHYDRLGDDEWHRLADAFAGRVSFEIHRRFAYHWIPSGARVLEIGAGTGRFTEVLAGCDASAAPCRT